MKMKITNIAEVGLKVEDLSKMIEFYEETLGFEVEIKEPQHAFLKIGELNSPLGAVGHPLILGLFERGKPIEISMTTLDHLAFEVPNEEYEGEYERFKGKGMIIRERVWPDTLPWRGRSFFIKDPEGNVVEIITSNSIP
jgi:catechol 2,3-dioxygenase-like lactoylglutathione lyase family enzyme